MAEEKKYLGMHNGTVKGKGFEKSRRARKPHDQRRSDIANTARSKK